MKRQAPTLLLVLFLFAAGCDTYDDRYESGTRVYTHHVRFDMDDARVNGNVASVQYDVPDIGRNVLENGAVLAFFEEQDTWTAMPYTYGVESPDLPAVDYVLTLGYAYDRGLLEVFYEASLEDIDADDLPDRRIKVVIIEDCGPGKQGVDLTDWDEVKAHFGLAD